MEGREKLIKSCLYCNIPKVLFMNIFSIGQGVLKNKKSETPQKIADVAVPVTAINLVIMWTC